MNMEELKLIAETIGKLGDAGQVAFGWWLLADKVFPALCWLAVIATLAMTAYRIAVQFKPREGDRELSLRQRAYESVRYLWLYGNTKNDVRLMEMTNELKAMVEESK
jgi:hypothetical protein